MANVTAFSIGWPYIVYSGLDNDLIIINIYKRHMIHRVLLAEKGKSFKICQSFISDSKDLFIMILENKVYKLKFLDLDEINEMENDIETDNNYKFTELIQYEASYVKDKKFLGIHARGSSRKEKIQTN